MQFNSFITVIHRVRIEAYLYHLRMGLSSFLGLAVINFAGAALCAVARKDTGSRVLDLPNHSHNWIHVLVATGAFVCLRSLLEVAHS